MIAVEKSERNLNYEARIKSLEEIKDKNRLLKKAYESTQKKISYADFIQEERSKTSQTKKGWLASFLSPK